MVKFQVRRWSERPRMLVFMLGVMLPAATLIAVGVWHLRTIQREKSIEAVFQREYQQVLAIAEKRIDARAYEITEEARRNFPLRTRTTNSILSWRHTKTLRMHHVSSLRDRLLNIQLLNSHLNVGKPIEA